MTLINSYLTNNDGSITVPLNVNSWHESQKVSPAIRDIPTSTTGQHVDTGTYLVECRSLELNARFTQDDKTKLNAIFNECKQVNITLLPENGETGWFYLGWIKEKDIKWQYAKTNYPDSTDDDERVWVINIKMDVVNFVYYSDFIEKIEG